MNNILKTLRLRHRRLEVEACTVNSIKTVGDYTLVESNGWYGIRSSRGQTLLEPVYDCIDVLEDACMCVVKVLGRYLLYNLSDNKSVSQLEMNHYQRFYHMLEVTTDDGVGLFSCKTHQLLVPSVYQETTHVAKGRYLWVKTTDGEYAFYDTQKKDIVRCPMSTSECLDGPEDYMFVIVDHKVYCINETGNYDPDRLRAFALRSKGRIRLTNYNRNLSIITDIYGRIIN